MDLIKRPSKPGYDWFTLYFKANFHQGVSGKQVHSNIHIIKKITCIFYHLMKLRTIKCFLNEDFVIDIKLKM